MKNNQATTFFLLLNLAKWIDEYIRIYNNLRKFKNTDAQAIHWMVSRNHQNKTNQEVVVVTLFPKIFYSFKYIFRRE